MGCTSIIPSVLGLTITFPMQLLGLSAKNFGSYTDLDLRFPTAVGASDVFITGVTGAGKSTILEIVSMALFGRTRGSSIDTFISRLAPGEYADRAFSIELEFSHAGSRYIIKRSKRRKDQSSKFGLWRWISDADGSNGEWYDETKKGKSRQLVEDIIGLNYSQFTMTVMSPQKKSDLFLQADPIERRSLISSLRGIDNLKLISEKAKLKAKELNEEIEKQYQGSMSEESIDEALKTIEENLQAINASLSELEEKSAFFDSVESAQVPLRNNREKKSEVADKIAKITEFISVHPNIVAEHSEFEKLSNELQEKGQGYISQRREGLASKKREATSSIESKLTSARHAREVAEGSISAFSNLKSEDESKLTSARRQLEALKAGTISDLSKVKIVPEKLENMGALISQISSLSERSKSFKSRAEEYVEKKKQYEEALKEHASHSSDDEGTCPTCGQKLSDESKKAVISSLENSIATSRAEYEKALKEAENLSEESEQSRLKAISGYTYEISAIEKRIENHENAVKEHSSNIEKHKEEEETLLKELEKVSEKFSGEEEEIENEAKLVNEKLARTAELNRSYADFGGIIKAHAFFETSESAKKGYEKEIAAIDKNTEALMEAYRTIAGSGVEKGYIASTADLAPANISELRREIRSNVELEKIDQGKNLQSREQWLAQREQNSAINKRVAGLEEERSKYAKIAAVFGKDGIQKDIIAETKELIQLYANEALYDFSDGRFTIELALTRKTKQKDVITREFKEEETLDVVVYDRDTNGLPAEIESLSGGESFMVDLALRHGFYSLVEFISGNEGRSGESAFIVDEGFAAIDKDGTLDRVIGTLNKLKRRYGQLIVISHVKEIGSIFSNALRVERDEENRTVVRYVPVTEVQA